MNVRSAILLLVAFVALLAAPTAHARIYNAETGRWLTRDPLGSVDGPSLYEYTAGKAIVMRDPMGLSGAATAARDDPGCDDPMQTTDLCRLGCCALHDYCYDVNNCSFPTIGEACEQCDLDVAACYASCSVGVLPNVPMNCYCHRRGCFFPHVPNSTDPCRSQELQASCSCVEGVDCPPNPPGTPWPGPWPICTDLPRPPSPPGDPPGISTERFAGGSGCSGA